jgi:segregation and condensation protein B
MTPEPLEPPDGYEELTLDKLSQSFARLFGGELPSVEPAAPEPVEEAESAEEAATLPLPQLPSASEPYEVTPRRLLEAMLFVGSPGREPLSAERVASLMRGVEAEEVHQLVRDLNDQYAADRCPYRIASEGPGYRLVLREQFQGLRDKFHGRVRQARLSQAAIDVLAIVAYNQPLTGEEVGRLRNVPSGAVLSQLVRRRLLRIEREESHPRQPRYYTTDRFLDLFGLSSLDDLPQSHDLE